MSKSELKRLIVQNPEGMAERILELERMCGEKDAENERLMSENKELRIEQFNLLSEQIEAQAQIAMQAEALKAVEPWLICAYSMPPRTPEADYMLSEIKKTILSSSETIAAFRAKETEPYKREVVMLLRAEQCPNCDNVGWYQVGHEENEQCEFCYTNPKSIYNVHRDLQGSALAYEREVQAKALEDMLMQRDIRKVSTHDCALQMIAELRASKGEVK